MLNIALIGRSGAIGSIIYDGLFKRNDINNLFVPNKNLLNFLKKESFINIGDRQFDIIILSVGTYGGLKKYVEKNNNYEKNFYINQKSFVEKFLKKKGLLINISSAVLENKDNLKRKSKYFAYSSEKMSLENMLNEINDISCTNLRPTNIISKYEDFNRSEHVFSSIFKNLLKNQDICKIWSSDKDWREFTDENILKNVLNEVIDDYKLCKKIKKRTIAFGRGKKILIKDLSFLLKKKLDLTTTQLIFDQPFREGPLKDIIGLKQVSNTFPNFKNNQLSFEKIVEDVVKNFLSKLNEKNNMEFNSYFVKIFKESIETKKKALSLSSLSASLKEACEVMIESIRNKNKIIFAGNGGSAADAQHLAAELVNRFEFDRNPLPSISLTTDTSVITSISNDYGYKYIFSKQLESIGSKGDVFVGITTSGNSENIIEALKIAHKYGIKSIVLCGSNVEKIPRETSHIISVPSNKTARIQETHILLGHIICGHIENYFFNNS